MITSSINIQGNILTYDILERISRDEEKFQAPKDYGFQTKSEILGQLESTWGILKSQYGVFKLKQELLSDDESGITVTRKYWMDPFLSELGYEIEKNNEGQIINDRNYYVSDQATNLKGFPVHVIGVNHSLDSKYTGKRMSAHALIQEYLNNHTNLYALVTNGKKLRLLRDSSLFTKISYVEFDLEKMFSEDQFSDFIMMWKLIHFTRMPEEPEKGPDSVIENYHLSGLESGSRIRENLSKAVKKGIEVLGNGLLQEFNNQELKIWISENSNENVPTYYGELLRFIYRILFIMVIEERDLVYPEKLDKNNERLKRIYYSYYSLQRLRKLAGQNYYNNDKNYDLWEYLLNVFELYEDDKGQHLGIKALAGNLFSYSSIRNLRNCRLNNEILLSVFKGLNFFKNDQNQYIQVNYKALDVEEFGSVYEGLLELKPAVDMQFWRFSFIKGEERSVSGSHYTPDELVQPLIKHSLEYLISDINNEDITPDQKIEKLLKLTVCDVACGSGHILLAAARRIGLEVARLRSGEEQPNPQAARKGTRDAIVNCIYGVDLNPLAVELCKVALWLEAHNPNEPLNFLDHHIKCGNAIVGLAHFKELENGIADEAFKKLPGDDDIATAFRNKNNTERKTKGQLGTYDLTNANENLFEIRSRFSQFQEMPENTPEEISAKSEAYKKLTTGKGWWRLKQLADLQVAQFFIPKTEDNKEKLTTDAKYRTYLNSGTQIQDRGAAIAKAAEQRFFHWFLEFPEVFSHGGFDCILGNPPYLGGKRISGKHSDNYLNQLKSNFSPAKGGLDLVVYFIRRIYDLLQTNCCCGIITTNTVSQGDSRKGGLDFILNQNGTINFANKSIKWPGEANVTVTLFSLFKNRTFDSNKLNGHKVNFINSLLEEGEFLEPFKLESNSTMAYCGSVLSGEGFIINKSERDRLINQNYFNNEVIFKFLNGKDFNNSPIQDSDRYVINFFDMSLSNAEKYPLALEIIKNKVKPVRDKVKRKIYREKWWLHAEKAKNLYSSIQNLDKVIVTARTSKTLAFGHSPSNYVFSANLTVFTTDSFSVLALLQSNIHSAWAWKFGTTLKSDLIYAPNEIVSTYPFPIQIKESVGEIMSQLSTLRKNICTEMHIGLTKLYNHFNNKKNLDINISKLRGLHKEMDEVVLEAYGWHIDTKRWGKAINLKHDFYEVDYLPENDRVRYTIHPEARKEVLKRLLLLNHEMHECEERGIPYEQLDAEKTLEIYKDQINSWLSKPESLHPKTLKFLCSGEDLLPTLETSTTKSFNPFVNEYSSALENELQQKIFVAFNDHFQMQWEGKEEERNAFLNEQIANADKAKMLFKALKANSDKYTMGNMHFFLNLIWNENSNTVKSSPLMQEFKDFAYKRYSTKLINKDVAGRLDSFIKKFRNEAAHTGELSKAEALECMTEVRWFINLLVESEITTPKLTQIPLKKKVKTAKKGIDSNTNIAKEPVENYGQGTLFEEPYLFNQVSSNKVIKQGSLVLLKPEGKNAHWVSIGANAKDAQKLHLDSAMAQKLLGKKVGDNIDFGNGFKVLEVK